MSSETLQFLPLSTSIHPTFWHALTALKLHQLKLSQAPVPITGHYAKSKQVRDRQHANELVGISSGLELDGDSFDRPRDSVQVGQHPLSSDRVRLKGTLINFNTIEEFKQCDKAKLAHETALDAWNQINSHDAHPSLASLNSFLVVTFADLKKYKYYYWACFPALVQKPGWGTTSPWKPCEHLIDLALDSGIALARPTSEHPRKLEYAALAEVTTFWANVPPSSRTLVYLDPSSHPTAPGWTLRNVLSYLSLSPTTAALSLASVRLVVVRESSILETEIQLKAAPVPAASSTMPNVVGWEKNPQGNLGPRLSDLSPLMDPLKLADQAVELNLQLMRWRILPELDLERIKQTKCLVLGAGTLGCYISRVLMAWGVKRITLLDSSTVSFSNPVRQPLFEFKDSLKGGLPKAQAAAESLKRIYPGIDATGISLSIPMPGHPIPPQSLETVEQDFETLVELIEQHDVVYLGMDSRESRWLPTLLGAIKGKLVMNVALGFDTFLVMRHGTTASSTTQQPVEPTITRSTPYRGKLGCYYCNDVVAPMDSLSDRTLDQMCTVTRPGLAAIASATAVELMVSILQHPLGIHAPSDVPQPSTKTKEPGTVSSSSEPKSVLGEVPHQIRGFLSGFNNLKITGQAYDRCTGCSESILEAFRQDGFNLVRQVCQDAKHLERITGLDKLEEETERMLADGVDWEEETDPDQDDF
ncbi:Atg7p [Sporobolomyces koalae]|uniref:Atg7p n=1 Tax=Sporobolomyces koalae TaxID=500713 RepID=UPI00316F07FD